MRFSFDFVVRMVGSQVIEADNITAAKKKLEALLVKIGGRGLVDFEIIKTRTGPLAAMTELVDLKKTLTSSPLHVNLNILTS